MCICVHVLQYQHLYVGKYMVFFITIYILCVYVFVCACVCVCACTMLPTPLCYLTHDVTHHYSVCVCVVCTRECACMCVCAFTCYVTNIFMLVNIWCFSSVYILFECVGNQEITLQISLCTVLVTTQFVGVCYRDRQITLRLQPYPRCLLQSSPTHTRSLGQGCKTSIASTMVLLMYADKLSGELCFFFSPLLYVCFLCVWTWLHSFISSLLVVSIPEFFVFVLLTASFFLFLCFFIFRAPYTWPVTQPHCSHHKCGPYTPHCSHHESGPYSH